MPNKESEREMPVATIEELDAVDPGGVMTVREGGRAHEWRKRDDGRWDRDGVALPSRYFVGSVAAGVVNIGNAPPPRPELGQVWANNGGRYRALVFGIVRVGEVEAVLHLRLRTNNRYVDVARTTIADFHAGWHVADPNVIPPEQRAVLNGLGEQYLNRRNERDEARREAQLARERLTAAQRRIRELERAADAVPPAPVASDEVKRALTQFAVSEELGELTEILRTSGLLLDIEHRTRVRIHGTSTVKPEGNLLGTAFTLTDSGINWERSVEVVKTGVGCTCNQIEESDLEHYLPTVWDEWEWETECAAP